MKDASYVGSGRVYLKELGASTGYVDIGNCSQLNISPQTDSQRLADYTQPGGGTANQFERLTSVNMTMSFHDFNAANLALALRGGTTTVTASTVTAEVVAVIPGTYSPTAKIPTAITSVTSADGVTTFDVGDDYEIRSGGIYIPIGSAIVTGNVKVSYTHAAQKVVEAFISAAKKYELLFEGLNEAQSGAPVRIQCYRVSTGLLGQLAAISTDYAAGEVSGELLKDSTRTGAGLSQYLTVTVSE